MTRESSLSKPPSRRYVCYNLFRSIPLCLQEDKLQPVKRQLLPERFLQEHDEQRKGGIGGGGDGSGSAYPGVEEPILDFLASPAIREEGQAGRNFPLCHFLSFFRHIYFPLPREARC